MVGGKMRFQLCVDSATILMSLLVAMTVGMPNAQGRLSTSIPAPGSRRLSYAQPPVKFLDRNDQALSSDNKGSQPLSSTLDSSLNVAKAVPYVSRHSQIARYPNAASGQDDRQIFGGAPSYNNNIESSDSKLQLNPITYGGTQHNEFPTLNMPSQTSPVNNKAFNQQIPGSQSDGTVPNFNPRPPVFSSNPKSPVNNKAFNQQIPGSQSDGTVPNFNQRLPVFPSNPKSPVNNKAFNQQIPGSQSDGTVPNFNQRPPVFPSSPKSSVNNNAFNQRIPGSQTGSNFPNFNQQSPVFHSRPKSSVNNNEFNQRTPGSQTGSAFPNFNQRSPKFPSNPETIDSANSSPSNTNRHNLFGTGLGQGAHIGQPFTVPSNANFFNPLEVLQQNTQSKGQEHRDTNYIPILARGFSVPTIFSNGQTQTSSKPVQSESLYSVANPSQDKREIIGTYMPRNDFVNPQMFAIQDEDKHNIVNRIFGAFQTPVTGNSRPSNEDRLPFSSTSGAYGNDGNFFNRRDESQAPRNAQPSTRGQPNSIALGPELGIYNKNNDMKPSKTAQANARLGNTNSKTTVGTPYSPIGSVSVPKQNKLTFSGGFNPRAFPKSGSNKTPLRDNRLNKAPKTDNSVQRNIPSGAQSSSLPSQINSIPSFENSDLFSNAQTGFGSFSQAFDKGDNAYRERSIFTDRQTPVPLFPAFSQREPLTVDKFRSKNLLNDKNFGQTEYDRNRPTSLNLLGNENEFSAGGSIYRDDGLGVKSGNNFGANSGRGGFQQIDGNTVTSGNNYDNVLSRSQGYNKNFDDSSNVANSRPSSITKQGGFSNAYQQNDAFDRAGTYSDGNDYANQSSFKDGDSTSNQRASNHQNEKSFRNSFENEQQADDKKSFNNADGYNNAVVNGRNYDLSDGYTDNVNYNNQNSDSSQQHFNDHDGYQRGVANVGKALADKRGDLYANLPTSDVRDGLPQESSYKPFDVNKPVLGGAVLS